jgi:hypothetical protein
VCKKRLKGKKERPNKKKNALDVKSEQMAAFEIIDKSCQGRKNPFISSR